MFELLTPTPALLTSVTNRVETHGKEEVPAISLGLKITTTNTILDRLSATLRRTLYRAVDAATAPLDGVEEATPLLRSTGIDLISLRGELKGWTLYLDWGADESDPITLGGCKVDAFKVKPHQGGTVDLFMRIGTSDVEPEDAGTLWSLNHQEITVTLKAPERPKAPIDGTVAAFEADHPLAEEGQAALELTPEDALAASEG